MSLRYEYVPPTAGVDYVYEVLLDVEDPQAIVIPATPDEVAALLDRIAPAAGLTHDRRSHRARELLRRTRRYRSTE